MYWDVPQPQEKPPPLSPLNTEPPSNGEHHFHKGEGSRVQGPKSREGIARETRGSPEVAREATREGRARPPDEVLGA